MQNPEGAEAGDPSPGGKGLGSRIRSAWNNPAYRFVFLFLFYLGVVAVGYPPLRHRYIHLIDALSVLTATIEYWTLSIFTSTVSISGKVVVYQGFAVKIIEECTGIYEVLIFTAAVLAFPTTWAKKGIGLGLGIPILYFFNVVRICILILIGRYFPEYFDFTHLYFMQATLILMITSVWLLWIVKVVKNERTDPVGDR